MVSLKVGDNILFNPGTNIYEVVYTALANPAILGVDTRSTGALAALSSRGIGKIIEADEHFLRIHWLVGDTWNWWYKRRYIENNFHTISGNL